MTSARREGTHKSTRANGRARSQPGGASPGEPNPRSRLAVAEPAGDSWPTDEQIAAEWSKHRPVVQSGPWYDDRAPVASYPGGLSPNGIVDIRHLGSSDSLAGLDPDAVADLRPAGYRHLVDLARGRGSAPLPSRRVPSPGRSISFRSPLDVWTLRPESDGRINFGRAGERWAIHTGEILSLFSRLDVGGLPALALNSITGRPDPALPLVTVRSKQRLMFNEAARGQIEGIWGQRFEECEVTFVGPGVDFLAAIMPARTFSEMLNSQISMEEEK